MDNPHHITIVLHQQGLVRIHIGESHLNQSLGLLSILKGWLHWNWGWGLHWSWLHLHWLRCRSWSWSWGWCWYWSGCWDGLYHLHWLWLDQLWLGWLLCWLLGLFGLWSSDDVDPHTVAEPGAVAAA